MIDLTAIREEQILTKMTELMAKDIEIFVLDHQDWVDIQNEYRRKAEELVK